MRFPEFNNAYKEIKLKNVLTRHSNVVNKDPNESYYQIGIRSHGKGIFYKEPEKGREIGDKRIFWIVPNCLIINIVFAWERAVAKTTNKELGMVASHRFPMYKVNENSLDYVLHYLLTEKGEKLLKMASPGGAGRNKTLNQEDFLNSKIFLPSFKEQEKISLLLSLLEKRIATQIKIIEDLITLKKSIIERTFSIVDSSWNEFSFKDIFNERKEMHIKDSSVIHATLSKEGIFPKTDRYDRDFLVKDEDKKYKVSYLNDICYNPANLKFGVITRNNYGKCIISPIYVTYEVKPSFNSKFIELFVTRSTFLKEIRKYEQGTVYERMAVSSDDFLTYTTRLPSIGFQNKIVNKIDIIDKKITQEKIYLELLKKQKNYLLSNLFI